MSNRLPNPTRLLFVLISMMLAGLLFSSSARADVGVQPILPTGSNITSSQPTSIQMQDETIKVKVRQATKADNAFVQLNPAAYGYELHPVWFSGVAEVQADFTMKNPTAEPVSMAVWFPLASALEQDWSLNPEETVPRLEKFKVTVDHKPAEVTISELPNPKGADKPLLPWASFPVTFPAGKKTNIQVSYVLPLQPVPKHSTMALNYIFQTGAGWADRIVQARLILNLPYPASSATMVNLPPGVILEGNKAIWTWENFEPGPSDDFFLELLTPAAWQQLETTRLAARNRPRDLQTWLDLAALYRNLSLNLLTLRQHHFARIYLPLSLQAYQKAVRLAPQHPAPHAGLALVALAQYVNDPHKPAALLETANEEYKIAKTLAAQDPALQLFPGSSEELLIWLDEHFSQISAASSGTPSYSEATATTAAATPSSPPTYECPGAPPILLHIQEWALVSTDPPWPNRLRSQPDLQAGLVGRVQPGQQVLVVDGPRCADSYTWWYVVTLDGIEGWTVEGDVEDYWLIPSLVGQIVHNWQRMHPDEAPSPRKGVGMVYDSARNVIVLAGGTDWQTVSGETWEHDGLNWHLRKDVNQFTRRAGAAMAYDSDRQVTVMFGGYRLGNTRFFRDTWEYDGKKWTQKRPAQSPPARNGAVMAYDPLNKRMILFGGFGGPGNWIFFDDTWEYAAGQWRQLTPTHHPPAREAAGMVYDAARQVMVLFGGGIEAGSLVFQDTWEWNGQNWNRRTDLPTSPPARWAFMMAYDSDCQRAVIYSGLKGTTEQFIDTWTYDGKTWQQVLTHDQPIPRWDGGMVYDDRNQRLLMFGGQSWSGRLTFLNDTWAIADLCR